MPTAMEFDNLLPAEGFLVCVNCMTYNQSKYIVDALDGFVMQQTDFPFIAIVVDDASTDGEQEIIKAYVEAHFDNAENTGCKRWETEDAYWAFARHKENRNCHFLTVCLKRNLFREPETKMNLLKEWMNAKYMALCEGDDYWTDSLKLRKQVEILEADASLMAVVTNSKVVDKEGNTLVEKQNNVVPENGEGRYDLRSFMYKVHNYPTASVCFRRTHVDEIARMTKHTENPYLADWPLWISLHLFGDFYYLDEVTSAYRVNPASVTHTCDRVGRAKANWTICKAVRDILPDEYDDIRKSLDKNAWMWIDLGFAYKHEKRYVRMLWCFVVAFLKDPKGLFADFQKRKQLKTELCQQQ